jgi:type IV pilus assembly protein PilB
MSASLELPGERTSAGMQATGRPRIGELLLERRLITEAQLEGALVLQRQTGRRVGETLVELGALSSHDLTQVLAEWFGFEFVDLAGISIDWILAQQIPEEIAHRYQVLPITARDGALVVAMANPEDVFALDDVTLLAKAIVVPVMAEPGQLARAIERAWNRSEVENSLDDARTDLATADELSDGGETTDDGPIVRFVNAVIDQAIGIVLSGTVQSMNDAFGVSLDCEPAALTAVDASDGCH